MAIKRDKRGVIVICIRRALLEINRVNGEAPLFGIILFLASSETEQLDELPAILRSVSFIGQEWINEIVFPRFDSRVFVMRKQRRNCPSRFQIFLLVVKKRPDGLHAMSHIQ